MWEELTLSPRLAALDRLVPHGARVADVGCDHGKLSCALALRGDCGAIAASDLRQGPLTAARENAERWGTAEKIEFRLCDGIPRDLPWTPDTVILAGMGGDTIRQILTDAGLPRVRLLLQPQTKIPELLLYLRDEGYGVTTLETVWDEGRLYEILALQPGAGRTPADERQAAFFPLLMQAPEGRELARRQLARIRKALTGLASGEETPEREQEKRRIRALEDYGRRLLMPTVKDVLETLDGFAPLDSKLDFDNCGLLAGWSGAGVTRVLLALDVTTPVIEEAKELGAELIVTHHPLTFGAKTITDETGEGKRIAALLRNGISAICMHTNLDAAPGGVNDTLAERCGLEVLSLLGEDGRYRDGTPHSCGRICKTDRPMPVREFAARVREALGSRGVTFYDAGAPVSRLGLVSGSGGSMLALACRAGCDTFLTGEVKYDAWLTAREMGVNLIAAGHFATENPVLTVLERLLRQAFPALDVRISRAQRELPEYLE